MPPSRPSTMCISHGGRPVSSGRLITWAANCSSSVIPPGAGSRARWRCSSRSKSGSSIHPGRCRCAGTSTSRRRNGGIKWRRSSTSRRTLVNEYPSGAVDGSKTQVMPTCMGVAGVSRYTNEASMPSSRCMASPNDGRENGDQARRTAACLSPEVRSGSSDGREVVGLMEDLGRILVVATVSDRLGVCEERRVALSPLLHRDGGAFCPAGALQLRTEERCERDQVADLVPASPFSVGAGVRGAIGGLEHAEVDTSHGCAPFLSVLWSLPSRLLPGNGRSERRVFGGCRTDSAGAEQ